MCRVKVLIVVIIRIVIRGRCLVNLDFGVLFIFDILFIFWFWLILRCFLVCNIERVFIGV